ncbi:MAG TPA: tetratricopeptide repeat protein, partial [Dehalococcoidia bacterium]|nr:tetratricopeptide repeat protein [Dehalococcoidia bacterium]
FRRAITAARQIPEAGEADLARLYEALGDVCELAALYADATDAYRSARRLAVDDRELLRHVLIKDGVVRERVGRYPDALRWYARALREALPGDAADRARIATGYAAVRFRQGKYADCAAWCRRAIPDAEAGGNRASLAHAYFLLGHASTFLGGGEGPEFRRRALEIYEELGDLVGQANVLNNMGVAAHMYEGDWKRALDFFRRSREARERAGDIMGAATASNNIGEILWEQGHRDEAVALFTSALETWRGARYPIGVAVATANLGWAAARSGDLERGRRHLEDALAIFHEIRADAFVFETRVRLAQVRALEGQRDGLGDEIDALIAQGERIDGVGHVAPALFRLLAEERALDGDVAAASRAITESIDRARAAGAWHDLMLALETAVQLMLAPPEAASAYSREAHDIRARLDIAAHADAVPPAAAAVP